MAKVTLRNPVQQKWRISVDVKTLGGPIHREAYVNARTIEEVMDADPPQLRTIDDITPERVTAMKITVERV